MDPDNKTTQGNDDQSTKQVLEYYQRFSQNKDLPKYFSGSSVSYLPEIRGIEPDLFPQGDVVITTNVDIIVTGVSDGEDDERIKDISRASSSISNRRLEWDNGADIGYDNCQKAPTLFKSSSLPVLSQIKDTNHDFILPKSDSNVKVFVFNYSSSEDSPVVKSLHSTTSSSPAPEEAPIISSTTSTSLENKQIMSSATTSDISSKHPSEDAKISSSSSCTSESKLNSFAATLLYLKEKIGLPDAHSTPNIVEVRKSDSELISPPKTPAVKKKVKKSSIKQSKTEPVFAKPSDSLKMQKAEKNVAESASKVLQTENIKTKVVTLALTKPITVECTEKVKSPKNKIIQTVLTVNTIGIQTDIIAPLELANLISRHVNTNQSVMFMGHSDDERKNECCTQTESDVVASNCDSFEYIKNNEGSPEINKQLTQTEETALPAYDEGRLKRSQRITDLNAVAESLEQLNFNTETEAFAKDVEKSVELLQKLLRSKNYDSKTKKKYMKRIIQKITNSKFLEDSSTSSELFCPKKVKKTVRIDTSDSSDPKSNKNWLDSNLPWYPAHAQLKSSKMSQLNVKTFSTEIPGRSSQSSSSQPEIIPIDSRKQPSKHFTLTNNEFAVKSSSQDTTSLEKHCDSSSSKCYENWRDDKTTSEKLLEVKSSCNNYLVDIAKKEKEYQITWINNEINHLSKLKNLLEEDASSNKITSSTYRVCSDKDEGRNYVIETNLGAKTSGNMNFNLAGKKYSVEEINQGSNSTDTPRVVGDIDVSIHDKVTNIRVKTSCQKCKEFPCACSDKNSEKSSHSTICLYCKRARCICNQRKFESKPSSGYSGMFLPATYPPKSEKSGEETTTKSKTVCSICGMLPCMCTNRKTVTSSELLRDYKALNSTNNSLKRVFENCRCSSQGACNCNFVEKLVRHFKMPRSSENVHNMEIQTEEINKDLQQFGTQTDCYSFEDTGVQAKSKNVVSMKIQTGEINKHLQKVATQTDCCSVEHMGVQAKSAIKSISSQTCQQCKSQEVQVGVENKDNNVQTPVVQVRSVLLQTVEPSVKPIEISSVANENGVNLQSNLAQTEVDSIDRDTQAKRNMLGVKTQTICDIISTPTQVYKDYNETAQQTPRNLRVDKHSEAYTFLDSLTQTKKRPNRESTISQTKSNELKDDASQTNKREDKETRTDSITLKDAISQKLKNKIISESTNTCDCICNKQSRRTSTEYRPQKDNFSQAAGPKRMNLQMDTTRIPLTVSEPEFTEMGTSYSYAGIGNVRSKDLQTEGNDTVDKDVQYIENDKNEEKYTSISSGQNNGTMTASETYNTNSTSNSDKTNTKTGYVYVRCLCCKEKTPSDSATALRSSNQTHHLCHHCVHRRPILTSMCYTSPQHTCRCYDRSQYYNQNYQYCTCTKHSKNQDSRYCGYCRYKLKKTVKGSGGIAYTLTLENASPEHAGKKKKKSQSRLEEIKIKVPNGHSRKKYKDKENYHKKASNSDRETENNAKNTTGSNGSNASEKDEYKRQYTLQEYLNQNRPDFIDSAEYRRNVVQSSREQREDNKDQAKLKFLDENTKKDLADKGNRLFSEKEMKEITEKNYKKLPEVQERLNSQKEKRLRNADKMIKDVFTRKVQRNVLKGKSNFPIDTNIVSLPS